MTLPLLLALKRCSSAEREAVAELLKAAAHRAGAAGAEAAPIDLAPALEVVERYHGVEDTVRRAEQHMARATAAIAPFSDARAKRDLLAAARFAVGRDR